MFKKKAVIVSTAAGIGTASAIKDVTTTLGYWGISDITKYGISVQAMNWDMVSKKKKSKIEKAAEKIARKLSSNRTPKVSIKTKMMFSMMRMMQKNGMGSGEAEKEYWIAKGWTKGKRPWR